MLLTVCVIIVILCYILCMNLCECTYVHMHTCAHVCDLCLRLVHAYTSDLVQASCCVGVNEGTVIEQ